MYRTIVAAVVLLLMACGEAGAKSAGNMPYVATMNEQAGLLARCIPEKAAGSEGTTQIIRVRKEGDEVLTTYPWYNANGLALGWSPIAGKVAVMRVRQDEGLPRDKQVEFSFYIGDKLLASYTTGDLAKLGATVAPDFMARERGLGLSDRANYTVEGCLQVWNTNDYYFSVRLSPTQTLAFDVLTGKLVRIERDGSKQRMVPAETPAPAAAPPVYQPREMKMEVGQLVDGEKEHQFVYIVDGIFAFKTVEGLKAHLKQAPKGSTLTWAPGCFELVPNPLLDSADEMKKFEDFCAGLGIKFVRLPSG